MSLPLPISPVVPVATPPAAFVPVPAVTAAPATAVVAPVPAKPVPTPEPVKPPEPAADPRFAQLMAKETAIVRAQQELKAEREKLTGEAKEFQEWKAAREQRLRAPDEFLKKDFGPDWYEKLTELKLSGGKITPEFVAASVDERLADFEKRQLAQREEQLAAERTRVAEEQKTILAQFRSDTAEFVKSKADDYELINLHGAHNLVTNLIESHYQSTQKILTAKEAADLVETQLAEQVQKSLATKRFAAKAPTAPQAVDPKRSVESAQPRTLTNALTPSSTPNGAVEDFSDEARIRRAIEKGEAVRRARQSAGA